MIQKIAENIVIKQLECQNILEEDKDVYKYGYVLVLGAVVNIVLAFFVGIIFHEILFVLSFLLIFIPLRSFCGGWHASSSINCMVISNVIIFFVTLVYKNHWLGNNNSFLVILDVICMLLIVLCRTQDSKAKCMSLEEKDRCQRIVKFQLCVHFVMMMFMAYINYCPGVQLFLLIHIVQGLLLWCGKWKNEIEKRKVT